MPSIDVQHASWYPTLTLTERLASLERTSHDAAVDGGRAERRLKRRKNQYPFSEDGHFAHVSRRTGRPSPTCDGCLVSRPKPSVTVARTRLTGCSIWSERFPTPISQGPLALARRLSGRMPAFSR